MAFNIQNFMSHIAKYGELAKADKFDVNISIPNSLRGNSNFGSRDLRFQCEAAELPGRNMTMIEYRHHAFIERVPHFTTFNEIGLTFLCNSELRERKFFDSWIDSIIPINNGLVKYYHNDSYESQYASSIKIRQYKNTGELMYNCTLQDAIPTSISPLSLSWADDSILRLQVIFSYKYWKTEDVTSNI